LRSRLNYEGTEGANVQAPFIRSRKALASHAKAGSMRARIPIGWSAEG
jgi:hypothetical protein